MNNLFAYGTLLCEDIFMKVTGSRHRHSPCILRNFRRLRVRGEAYPGIIAGQGFEVFGMLYHDLPETAWKRLDDFEGGMYVRRRVVVELTGKDECTAFTYVVRPESEPSLIMEDWDLKTFLRAEKQRFINTYCGFDTCRRQS